MSRLDAESIRQPISAVPGARLDVLEVFSEIESTNSYLLEQPAPPPGRFRVALADHQTAGRGRLDKTWTSPPLSGLCLSMAYTFSRVPAKLPALTLALGIGVIEALQRLGIGDIGLKWPNDIMALGGKLGGVLTEARNGSDGGIKVVVGVGLNVDLPDSMLGQDGSVFRIKAVDLKQCAGTPPSRDKLSTVVIECLFDCMVRFESDGFAPFRKDWKKHDWLYGRRVIVETPDGRLSGTADGVEDDGALVVKSDSDRRRIIAGSVVLSDE